jgi:O-antigen ligase
VMPRVKMEVGGWNARPEHCAAVVVLIACFFRLLFRKSESPRFVLTKTDYWVAVYVLWNYVSSAWMSPDPKMTLRWALLTNLVVLPYFLIRFLVTNERTQRWAFNAFLVVGVVECVYAVVAYTSRHLLGTSFGVEIGQYAVGFEGVSGTQYEPNILGSYSACFAIMFLVLAFLPDRKLNWAVGGTMIAQAALLVSLSRAAFASFILASIVLLFLGVRRGLIQTKKVLLVGLGLALFLAPIAATGGRNLVARMANLSEGDVQNDVETMGRLVSWAVALEDVQRHPIVGNGTASFQLLAGNTHLPILGDQPWVANYIIRILHDMGLIGLLLFVGLIFSLGKQVKKTISQGAPGRDIVIALAAGCLVYAVAFMSAEGTMLSFFWVHLGLLASACAVSTAAAARMPEQSIRADWSGGAVGDSPA